MPTVAVSVRMDEALAARVDAFAAQLMTERPGLKVSRTEAIAVLLTEALDAKKVRPSVVASATKGPSTAATPKRPRSARRP